MSSHVSTKLVTLAKQRLHWADCPSAAHIFDRDVWKPKLYLSSYGVAYACQRGCEQPRTEASSSRAQQCTAALPANFLAKLCN